MLVGLSRLLDWSAWRRNRVVFPKSGLAYELFDNAVLLVGLSVFWYILTPPSRTTGGALRSLYDVTQPLFWGVALALVGAVAARCSYDEKRLMAGVVVFTVGVGFWLLALSIGALASFVHGEQVVGFKAVGLVLVYLWMLRHVWRHLRRRDTA